MARIPAGINVKLPRGTEPVNDGGAMSRPWYSFMQGMAQKLGLAQDTPIYEHLFVDGLRMNKDTGVISLKALAGNSNVYAMPNGVNRSLWFMVHLPNAYKKGTDITPYVRWAPEDDTAGDVIWTLSYSACTVGTAVTVNTDLSKTVATSGTTNAPQQTTFDDISDNTIDKGDSLACRLLRNGAASGDDYGADGLLFGVGFIIQVEGVGSEKKNP